jgi:hypothetical protein
LLVNAKGVENTGVELEATWAATDSLTLGGSIASYDPKFIDGTIINGAQAADGTITGGEDVSGVMPSYNVDFAYYLFASYDWQLSGGSSIRVRADVKHRDETWGANAAVERAGRNLNDDGFMYLKPAIDRLGLRVEWTSAEGNMGFSVWGRNLDDDPDPLNYGPGFGYVYNSGPGPDAQPAKASAVNGRRQIGATFRYNF